MEWSYQYTPHLWPFFASAVFLVTMGLYAYRDRTSPGAVAFLILLSGILLKVLSNALELAGTDELTRIFWRKFDYILLLPTITAALCFAFEYAGLGKWITPRTVLVLAVPPFVYLILVLTNDYHHLVWTRIWSNGSVQVERGPASWAVFYYAYFISLLHLAVLTLLFVRSPRHRWIAFWLILSPFLIRATYLFQILNWNLIEPIPMLVVLNLALLPYAMAIFRFHMFDVVPVVRDTVMEMMGNGMIVLDAKNRISDINKAGEDILGVDKSRVLGRQVSEALGAHPSLLDLLRDAGQAQGDLDVGDGRSRCYQISISSIMDQRGFHLGRLLLLSDITEQRQNQAKIMDYQRALAMLEEREILGRELHDGIGQLLAAAHLQVKAARELLSRGDTHAVESCLSHLADITQNTKEIIREYLFGIKSTSFSETSFLPKIRQYISHFSHNYGIHIDLVAPAELVDQRFDFNIEAQLLPIIQEALLNVRRHSGCSSARLIFSIDDRRVRITVEDQGQGFDLDRVSEKSGFGLRSMRGRANVIGAAFEVQSSPGHGTRIVLDVPLPKEKA
jgi:PAS domain S-box-containing protein